MGLRPLHLAHERLSVGIEQQFIGIEAMAILGIVGAIDPMAIECAGADLRQIAVPDLVCVLGQHDALDLAMFGRVE
jgi:hypothetical protein